MIWAHTTTPYGAGTLAPVGALADADLGERLRQYKRIIAKRYRSMPGDRCEEHLPEGRLWVSTKIDGQLFFLVARDGDCALCAANGRVLHGLPLLTGLAAQLAGHDAIIAGELFCAEGEGRARVHQLTAALGDPDRAGELRFQAFDLVEDGQDDALAQPYEQRLARLHQLLGDAHVITTEVVSRDQVPARYREWVLAGGHEGLVVRSERAVTFKIKPTLTLDLVVVAFGERITGAGHELRELVLALIDDDGHYQVIGSVGTGFSADERYTWHRRLSDHLVPSRYRMASGEGTLCRFVAPTIVVQVACTDLLTHDGHDHPLRRMRLDYRADGYEPLGEQPTAVMLHPRFERERDDKRADADDAGLAQIRTRVDLDPATAAAATDLPAATVHAREVYTKTTKGRTAVRKVLLIQTNKQDHAPYSPFVLFTTDFSPTRAEPLKTGLLAAATRARADDLLERWRADNVKRGWQGV